MMQMKLVVIESPYAGNVDLNLRYLRACMSHCLGQAEAPYASHALYTQPGVLDDQKPEQRQLGIVAGFNWRERADLIVFYVDLGWSPGMYSALALCGVQLETPFEVRRLGGEWARAA